jgi:hypothetical protein
MRSHSASQHGGAQLKQPRAQLGDETRKMIYSEEDICCLGSMVGSAFLEEGLRRVSA